MKLDFLARIYQTLMLLAVALIPSLVIWYLMTFPAFPICTFENHFFHESVIAAAIAEGGFISYASWKSYQVSGEVFLRWLTVGFLAFTLIYAPHGMLTRAANHNIWLFLLYGPASRLAMLGCIVYGQVSCYTRLHAIVSSIILMTAVGGGCGYFYSNKAGFGSMTARRGGGVVWMS